VVKKPKKSVAQRSMRRMLLALSIGIVVMLLAAAAGYGRGPETGVSLDDFDKAAVRELQSIADGAAQLLNVYMDARVTDMLVCSKVSGDLRDALAMPEARTDANRILDDWLHTSGAYEAILLVDKTGVCLASAPAGLVNQNFSDDEAFKGAINGKLTISNAHKADVLISLDRNSKGWTAAIAVPVKGENEVAGVLISFLKWSKLAELVMNVRIGTSGYVYVLNKENQVIIHPAEYLYGVSLRDPKINLPDLDDAITKKVPYYTYEFRNVRTNHLDTKLVGFAYPKGYGNFPGLGWTVGAGMDRSEAMVDGSIFKTLLRRFFFK
jgi:methyl-accepting chemotaxis protein